jgi:hypothetical protein
MMLRSLFFASAPLRGCLLCAATHDARGCSATLVAAEGVSGAPSAPDVAFSALMWKI